MGYFTSWRVVEFPVKIRTYHPQTICPRVLLWGKMTSNLTNRQLLCMKDVLAARWGRLSVVTTMLLAMGMSAGAALAQLRIYNPKPLPFSNEISDDLSENDIPTGQGGFARDYTVILKDGDQITIDLTSDQFDTIVTLLDANGSTVAENDDGPDGSTNSLLFARIGESGSYIVRVRAFGEKRVGKFTLKLTRLRPVL